MDASNVFISQALGIFILTMSLGFAIQPQHYKTAFQELMGQPSLKLIVSVIPLIIGTLLVLTHQHWDDRWDIFIGVLCWIIFIKGVSRVLLPKNSDKTILKCLDKPEYMRMSIGVGLLLGLLLCYHGFFRAI
ncbi:MAG: hypothetical protein A3F18_02575 [Legionellales bacterium RIFCSPHIGHO2_12_FULL_37_14]|nr:MAG: hypothetical protein A3F18_02575 [Legionellales bacterium RIFCSPHIGHO2_12_FULL_37_14]